MGGCFPPLPGAIGALLRPSLSSELQVNQSSTAMAE
jgi:hypothetical protein